MQEKLDNIKDAFAVDSDDFEAASVILIADIDQSGFSINEVGRIIQEAGAELVLGLTATKTMQDISEMAMIP